MKLGETHFRYFDANDRDVKKLFLKRNHTKIGNKCIDNSNGDGDSFNDMTFYKSLWNIKGCQNVELAAIGILWALGTIGDIYSIYRVTLQDGSTEMYDSKGSCSEDPSSWSKHLRKIIDLMQGEFLTGVIFDGRAYGRINRIVARRRINAVNGITIVTNMRQLRVSAYSGNEDGGWSVCMANNAPGMKIVALCGSINYLRDAPLPEWLPFVDQIRERYRERVRESSRYIEGIGYYIVPFRWEARRIHVLMRQLVQRNRAEPTTASQLATTMKALSNIETDLFRLVMRFL